MEAPLNAREFLKRFHLPQLVRISQDGGDELDNNKSMTGREGALPELPEAAQKAPGESLSWRYPYRDSALLNSGGTGDSRALRQQHEKSDWTYKPASRRLANEDDDDERQDRQQEPVDGGFRSLGVENLQQHQQRHSRALSSFCLTNQWPEVASQSEETRRFAAKERSAGKKSVDFETNLINEASSSPGSKQVLGEQARKGQQREESIRLAPPSRRPALSKLKLDQPFLLYKAYKKLELCAYVIDLKNELNEKSGDPIYFAQNYPGKCRHVNLSSSSSSYLCL